MKKIIFSLLIALPLLVSAQQKFDTIKLKNGKAVSGIIYKMEGGLVFLANGKDSIAYTADEIQMLLFCSQGQIKDPCSVSENVAGFEKQPVSKNSNLSQRSISNTSTYSSLSSNDNASEFFEKNDTEKGNIVFRCNMCGGKGTLSIRGNDENSKSTATYSFTMREDEHFFVYAVRLVPGEYKWTYKDTNKNKADGKFIIRQGEKKSIVLFENNRQEN